MCVLWKKLTLLRGSCVSELGEVTLKFWGFCLGAVSGKNGKFELGILLSLPPVHVALCKLILLKD